MVYYCIYAESSASRCSIETINFNTPNPKTWLGLCWSSTCCALDAGLQVSLQGVLTSFTSKTPLAKQLKKKKGHAGWQVSPTKAMLVNQQDQHQSSINQEIQFTPRLVPWSTSTTDQSRRDLLNPLVYKFALDNSAGVMTDRTPSARRMCRQVQDATMCSWMKLYSRRNKTPRLCQWWSISDSETTTE